MDPLFGTLSFTVLQVFMINENFQTSSELAPVSNLFRFHFTSTFSLYFIYLCIARPM